MMKRWLKSQKAPPAVQRQIEQALATGATGTEVEACTNCGTAHFVNLMVDLSTQDRFLLLCRRCADERTRLLEAPSRHHPTRAHSCLCSQPIEAPIHYTKQEDPIP